MFKIKNTGTIYADNYATAVGSIIGYASGATAKITMEDVIIRGSVQTKEHASNIGGLYGYFGNINYYLLQNDNYKTSNKLAQKISILRLTYDFSIGTMGDGTYVNVKARVGGCSNPEDTLGINNSYTLKTEVSTYTD